MASLPAAPTRGFSFTAVSTNTPTAQQPGVNLDTEFDRADSAISQVIAYLGTVLNTDGTLLPGTVGTAQLTAALAAQITTISTAAQVVADQRSLQWAEYLAGPVVDAADAPAYIAASPYPSGLYYEPVEGMSGGLFSAKWWAIQAQATANASAVQVVPLSPFTPDGITRAWPLARADTGAAFTPNALTDLLIFVDGFLQIPSKDFVLSSGNISFTVAPPATYSVYGVWITTDAANAGTDAVSPSALAIQSQLAGKANESDLVALQAQVAAYAGNAGDLSSETAQRMAADALESAARTSADQSLAEQITNEVTRATGAEQTNASAASSAIASLSSTVSANLTAANTAVASEATTRLAGDNFIIGLVQAVPPGQSRQTYWGAGTANGTNGAFTIPATGVYRVIMQAGGGGGGDGNGGAAGGGAAGQYGEGFCTFNKGDVVQCDMGGFATANIGGSDVVLYLNGNPSFRVYGGGAGAKGTNGGYASPGYNSTFNPVVPGWAREGSIGSFGISIPNVMQKAGDGGASQMGVGGLGQIRFWGEGADVNGQGGEGYGSGGAGAINNGAGGPGGAPLVILEW